MAFHPNLVALTAIFAAFCSTTTLRGCNAFTQLFELPPPRSPQSLAQTANLGRKRTTTRLHLFESLTQQNRSQKISTSNQKSPNGSKRSSLHRIPEEAFDILSQGFGVDNTPPFPYSIELLPPVHTSSSLAPPSRKNDEVTGKDRNGQANRLIIRHLEEEDITKILPEVVREFGSIASTTLIAKPGADLATQIENYLFSLTVLIGLTQRVERRKKGYPPAGGSNIKPDHNVICLVEQVPMINTNNANGEENGSAKYYEQIVGIGEISWQPPDPNRTAPPFVLPFFIKNLLSLFSPQTPAPMNGESDSNATRNSSNEPKGYISNVLVYKTRRGLGYGRLLMAILEGIARTWGCEDVRLHVDANEISGKVARGLYWSLGYDGVPDRGYEGKNNDKMIGFDWMGPSMANQGLYLVDGIPLLYMCKKLSSGMEDD